jgi:ParB/RepB/Spo0J family partition protein
MTAKTRIEDQKSENSEASALAEGNASLAPAPQETAVQSIALERLAPNPLNPRKTFDDAALGELVQSIKELGVAVPLLVRPRNKPYFASQGELGISGKVWYLACTNIVGRTNLVETFSHQSEPENKAAAEKAALEKNGAEDFEIVAGERRWRASKLAGKTTVPCIVRALSDADAADHALVDNLQRKDVEAIEQAEGFGRLLQAHGSIEAVAARVGKDVAYVTRHLKLRTLNTWSRQALRERLIVVDHALLLARLGVEEQDAELKWVLDRDAGSKTPVDKVLKEQIEARKRESKGGYHWEPESVIQLKRHIEQNSGRKLSRAPWDLDDAALVREAGACNACPSNTKANTSLFADLAIEAPTCADGRCFEAKREQFVQIKLAHAGMPPGSAVRLSWKATSTAPRMTTVAEEAPGGPAKGSVVLNLKQVFKAGQWIEAKKGSCPNVITGVTVDWSDANDRGYMGGGERLKKPGQALLVCVAAKCKAHRKDWEKPKTGNGNGAPRESEAEREAKREKMRLAARAETRFRVRLAGEAIQKVTRMPEAILRRILLDQLPAGSELEAVNAVLPGVRKLLETAKLDSIEFARAVAVASIQGRHLEVWEHWEAKQFRKEFVEDLKAMGYDASKAWEKPEKQLAAASSEPPVKAKAKAEAPGKAAVKPPLLSAAARERIAAAQKKRWALNKKAAKKGGTK